MSKELNNLRQLRFLAISTELTTQAEVDELIEPIENTLTNYDKMVSSIKKHIKNLKAQRDELDKERDPILRDDVTIFILNSKIKLLADLLKEGTKNG